MATKATLLVMVVVVVGLVGTSLAYPADLYGGPTTYKEPGMPYEFAYGVRDDYAGADFGHSEDSDGNTVRGSYTVQLPDGRKQTVSYEADHERGFIANVQYEGSAQYPHETGPPVTFKPQNGYQQQPQSGYQ